MSWFGETFGDSLNTLKGQITKITKEALAQDEATSGGSKESDSSLVKELEALCNSKDLEIASLRDDFNKLQNHYQSQIELLKSSKEIKPNNINCDSDDLHIKKLENQLVEVRKERDHLNSCIEELQSEHQNNLDQIISFRDKYKSELEELRREHDSVKNKLTDALNNINKNNAVPNKENEIDFLKAQIREPNLQHEVKQSYNNLAKETECQNNLKEQICKLLDEMLEINKVKEKTEEDRKRIQIENEELKTKFILKENEVAEIEIKLKMLLNEKEDLLNKCKDQELLKSKLQDLKAAKEEVQQKLENLLHVLSINTGKESNMSEMIALVENKFHEKCSELSKNWKESVNDLELELKNLKEENRSIQEKLKVSVEKESEMERKHQQEISLLKISLSEIKNQEQDCIHQSETDDVKRLEQEITQCMALIFVKDKEITDYSKSLCKLEQELEDLRGSALKIEEELTATQEEKKELEIEVEKMKDFSLKINQEKVELQEKHQLLELEGMNLNKINNQLVSQLNELKKQVAELVTGNEQLKVMQEALQKATESKIDLMKRLDELQNENLSLRNESEHLKAQWIVKESSLSDLMKANIVFQNKVSELQSQCNALFNAEKEKEKWKDTAINLQIQVEDLIEKKEEVENECLKLKNESERLAAKDAEIQQLKLTNSNLMKTCNDLHQQLEIKAQEGQSCTSKECELEGKFKNQSEIILQLEKENSELKCRIQKFQEELKTQIFESKGLVIPKDNVQQHRRSKSAADTETHALLDVQPLETLSCQSKEEVAVFRQTIKHEQAKYQVLHHQFQEISSKEASARKEFERLKQHLIEVEDHYTEETVKNEKIINDLKSKLMAAEEQLQNSSTLYTSLKVRDNQHLESLQSQIRMVSAQRDDLQTHLSVAEDEVQKHKASLMSLQIVLEQFQQDKEFEMEKIAMRYEKQLQMADAHLKNLELEIDGLKKQLVEAKNGLKAASRLGEQLEKKTQQVSELEESQGHFNSRITELEQSLAAANQANSGKVDTLLIKNLVIGYMLSPNAERKSQVLRIMASVLDFNQEERNKMGVDATSHSGWLSNFLHPKGEGSLNNQSLSEAFIKFLENESRPQPQLKLLPEQLQPNAFRTSKTNAKPSGRLSELTLPTFNSCQNNDSSIILKNVLKDS